MKNLIKAIIVAIAFMGASCSNEEEKLIDNPNLKLENELFNRGNEVLIIEFNEIPSLSQEQSESLGYVDLVNDSSRDSFLDKTTNILNVPYDYNLSQKLPPGSGFGLCIKIKIARVNATNNGSCEGGCKECIGFRCEFVTFPCVVSFEQSREQSANVIVNESKETIEYHFQNEIDWEYMMN